MLMTTSIYCSFKELPASKVAEEQFAKAQETFELTVQAIKANLKLAEDAFVKERETARRNAQWEYSVGEPTVINDCFYYTITRKAVNPQLGDTEFYKDIIYTSFKIVNCVLIQEGSGYRFQHLKTGDVLTGKEIAELSHQVVPERFKNKPVINEQGLYLAGS